MAWRIIFLLTMGVLASCATKPTVDETTTALAENFSVNGTVYTVGGVEGHILRGRRFDTTLRRADGGQIYLESRDVATIMERLFNRFCQGNERAKVTGVSLRKGAKKGRVTGTCTL